MALNVPRWLVLALVSCGMIWFGLLFRLQEPDRRPPPEDLTLGGWGSSRVSPARAIEGQLARENDRLRLLELRDSVVRLAAAPAPSFALFVDPRLGSTMRRRVEDAVLAQWRTLKVPGGRRVAVAIVVDTNRAPGGLPRARRYAGAIPIEVFLPSAATGGTCVAMITLSSPPERYTTQFARLVGRNLSSPESIHAMLSPCAFLAAFGTPGPDASRWFLDTRWVLGKYAGWGEAASAWRDQTHPARGSLVDALATAGDASWTVRQFVAPEGIACLAARRNACARVLLDSRSNPTDSAWRNHVVSSGGSDLGDFYSPNRAQPLGPAKGWIVSEMVRTLGPERFARFWTSPLPIADAFHQATGVALDDWMRWWMRRMYGPTIVGPSLSAIGLVTGLVVVAAGLVLATLIGRRRRVV